jgi:hypothetical protein
MMKMSKEDVAFGLNTRTYWVPWLMEDGKQKEVLGLGRHFDNTEQITHFFTYMHRTHPHLVGKHIEFIETTVRDLTPTPPA